MKRFYLFEMLAPERIRCLQDKLFLTLSLVKKPLYRCTYDHLKGILLDKKI